MFFVIRNSDGDTSVTPYTHEMMKEALNDEDFGTDFIFLDAVPTERDTNYWGEGRCLIIKGEVVVPKAKEVVTIFEI